MIADKKTLKDLELFESSGTTIFELINRTRTTGGELKLKSLLKTPLETLEKYRRWSFCR